MKTKIETLHDLRAERARLKNQLELSQMHMHQELTAIKTEINPARQAVGALRDILTTPRKGLLNVGVGMGVDALIRRGLLARAGWLPRLVVPFIVRNVAANYIQKNRTSIIENMLLWVKNATAKPVEKAQFKAEKEPSVKKAYLNGSTPVLVKAN
ncbi:MAG: hypothetical protein R2822_04085 [Spirosomataceae bacterium]